jgi:hypothetical protein
MRELGVLLVVSATSYSAGAMTFQVLAPPRLRHPEVHAIAQLIAQLAKQVDTLGQPLSRSPEKLTAKNQQNA